MISILPDSNTPLVLVVGFDGSAPAQRALDAASELLAGRSGWLEIIYVAQRPAAAPLLPMVVTELTQIFDDIERELREDVSNRLASASVLWHFRRRDGIVADKLIGMADEFARQNPDATIVLVVGDSSRKRHRRWFRSVTSSIERVDRFFVVVVP